MSALKAILENKHYLVKGRYQGSTSKSYDIVTAQKIDKDFINLSNANSNVIFEKRLQLFELLVLRDKLG